MIRLSTSVLLAVSLTTAMASSRQTRSTPASTTIVRFTPATREADRASAIAGACVAPSRAAWFRGDAFRCTAGTTTYDPCFATAHEDLALCVSDPRAPVGAVPVRLTSAPGVSPASEQLGHRAWFFELTDGTTCRPLLSPGREVEGFIELYECRYGEDGPADAVVGDLDSSAGVWTISEVKINKKMEPPTIKWTASTAVKTVWQ